MQRTPTQTSFKLQEWQGILAAYAILLVGAQTSVAPLAVLMAWGISITYLLDVLANKGQLISQLFQPVGPSLSETQQGSNVIIPGVTPSNTTTQNPNTGQTNPQGPQGPPGPLAGSVYCRAFPTAPGC